MEALRYYCHLRFPCLLNWDLIVITISTTITTTTRVTDGNIQGKGVARDQTCRDPTGQMKSEEGVTGDKHIYGTQFVHLFDQFGFSGVIILDA